MNSLIFSTTTRILVALLILFSFFLLLRGHNDTGGGFVGGLVAAVAIILFGWSAGIGEARRLLKVQPQFLIGLGLLVSLSSGMLAFLKGDQFLTGHGIAANLLGITSLKLSTPLVFDVGVYLTVVGVTLAIILALAEE